MDTFVHHVGYPGNADLSLTVDRRIRVDSLLPRLSSPAERAFFSSTDFSRAFPRGEFNCWGFPAATPAEGWFRRMDLGDLLVMVHSSGGSGRGANALGVLKLVAPTAMFETSRLIWTSDPSRIFPWIVFFDTERGHIDWDVLCEEAGWSTNYRLQGRINRPTNAKYMALGGASGLLRRLRSNYGFRVQE